MITPRVSVIMPLYNTKEYVADAVNSILSQSLKNIELIIVDNGSTDGAYEYVQSLSDPRVHVIRATGRGAGIATNAGLEVSKSELLAMMDSDDVAHPDRLRIQTEFLDTHPEVVLLGTRFAFLVDSTIVPVPPQPTKHDQIKRALIDGRPVIHNPSIMFRARAARAIKGVRLPGPGADYDFFLRMSDVGKLHNLPDQLQYYRLHDRSSSIVGMLEVNRIHAYSLACAKARVNARHEPDIDVFRRTWSERSFYARVRERLDCRALNLYRMGLVKRSQGQWLQAAAAMTRAAVLNPTRTIWHLKRYIGIV